MTWQFEQSSILTLKDGKVNKMYTTWTFEEGYIEWDSAAEAQAHMDKESTKAMQGTRRSALIKVGSDEEKI